MQTYAKLTDGKIEFAPKNKGSITNYNLSQELMEKDGYKPLIVIEETTLEKPLIKYMETDKQIEQYSEAVPQPEPYVPTIEEKSDSIRQIRNQMIDDFEWRISRNNDEHELGLTETDDRESLLKYREYLRNYPETEDWYEKFPSTFEEWKEDLNATEQIKTMGDVYGTVQSN